MSDETQNLRTGSSVSFLNAHSNIITPTTTMMTADDAAPSIRHCCCTRMRHRTFPRGFSILLVGILLQTCSSLPLFMVFSGRGKCVSVEAAAQTALKVQYEAPGMYAYCTVYRHGSGFTVQLTISLTLLPQQTL